MSSSSSVYETNKSTSNMVSVGPGAWGSSWVCQLTGSGHKEIKMEVENPHST